MKKIALNIVALMFLFAGTVYAQDYVVIVNSSNSETSISKSDLSKIFSKRMSSFSNGVDAKPVDQTTDSSVRASFSDDVLNRSVSAMKNFWSQQLFSGAGVPPEELASDAAVVSYVASNPGGIGYVSAGADVSSVKVLSVE